MYEKAQDILIVLCYLLILIRLIKTCQSYHNRILYDADDDQSCKRKDLRWWSRKAAGWLALENGFNAMNGFNVSCLLCCLLQVLTVFTKPTNPPGGLCPMLCAGLSLCGDHRTQK